MLPYLCKTDFDKESEKKFNFILNYHQYALIYSVCFLCDMDLDATFEKLYELSDSIFDGPLEGVLTCHMYMYLSLILEDVHYPVER